ncbi:MAG: hypothetical protein II349_05850 [Akkermansia sp.]|nr:hypothetical protein [Akkermansia sp.]
MMKWFSALSEAVVEAAETVVPAAEPVAGVKVSASLALTVQLTPEKYAQLAERAAAAGITMESLIAQAISQLLDNSPDTNNISTLRNRKVILPVNP